MQERVCERTANLCGHSHQQKLEEDNQKKEMQVAGLVEAEMAMAGAMAAAMAAATVEVERAARAVATKVAGARVVVEMEGAKAEAQEVMRVVQAWFLQMAREPRLSAKFGRKSCRW